MTVFTLELAQVGARPPGSGGSEETKFIEHLLCTRFCISHRLSEAPKAGRVPANCRFTDEDTEAQGLCN